MDKFFKGIIFVWSMLSTEMKIKIAGDILDIIENNVKASKTQWDDTIVLPAIKILRHTLIVNKLTEN